MGAAGRTGAVLRSGLDGLVVGGAGASVEGTDGAFVGEIVAVGEGGAVGAGVGEHEGVGAGMDFWCRRLGFEVGFGLEVGLKIGLEDGLEVGLIVTSGGKGRVNGMKDVRTGAEEAKDLWVAVLFERRFEVEVEITVEVDACVEAGVGVEVGAGAGVVMGAGVDGAGVGVGSVGFGSGVGMGAGVGASVGVDTGVGSGESVGAGVGEGEGFGARVFFCFFPCPLVETEGLETSYSTNLCTQPGGANFATIQVAG